MRFQKALAQSLPKIAGVCALVLLTLALGLVLSRATWHAVLVPLTRELDVTVVIGKDFNG